MKKLTKTRKFLGILYMIGLILLPVIFTIGSMIALSIFFDSFHKQEIADVRLEEWEIWVKKMRTFINTEIENKEPCD